MIIIETFAAGWLRTRDNGGHHRHVMVPSSAIYQPCDARHFSWLAARRASDYCQWVNRAAVAPPIVLGRFAIATCNANAPDATGGCAASLSTSWRWTARSGAAHE
jgi:hypothetical protein